MSNLTIYGVYMVIIIVAIALVSGLKLILKRAAKVSLDTKWEYILSISSFVLAAGGNYIWLYFGCGFENNSYLGVMTTLSGTSTYIIYLLLFQSTRKIGLAVINAILAKKSAGEIAEEVESIIQAGDKTTAEQAESLEEAVTPEDDKIKSVIKFLKNDE